MHANRDRFIQDCRKERAALKKIVAALKAQRKSNAIHNATTAHVNTALDARIFNCECTIARFEIFITEAEAEAAA
jgi:hypothetical protein